jgi:hypothetical protein
MTSEGVTVKRSENRDIVVAKNHLEHVIASFILDYCVKRRHVQPARRYDAAFPLLLKNHRQPERHTNWNLRAKRSVLGAGSQQALASSCGGELVLLRRGV